MRKGRITIPTDESYVEDTKRIADLWGADAVRDCDGVNESDCSGVEQAVAAAKQSDCVILCLGESSEMSGEGMSRAERFV